MLLRLTYDGRCVKLSSFYKNEIHIKPNRKFKKLENSSIKKKL